MPKLEKPACFLNVTVGTTNISARMTKNYIYFWIDKVMTKSGIVGAQARYPKVVGAMKSRARGRFVNQFDYCRLRLTTYLLRNKFIFTNSFTLSIFRTN